MPVLFLELIGNRNVTYFEARKLIAPPISQTYSHAAKSSTISVSTQTDGNITKIKCPPLKLLQQPSSHPKPNISSPIPSVSASSAQADLLASPAPIAADLKHNECYTQQRPFHIQSIHFPIQLRCSIYFNTGR
ncbi:uncharacterized protein TNCV_1438501 [Trichonephila clavipes]|nr:uncharacterized protein TNCV_1438501 [Trichonephila clavipes]